jgi:Mrp family chromosome partitioning ATPase
VVDADLRNPSLGKVFGVTPERGFTDVLTGDGTLSEVTMSVPVEALGLETLERIHARSAGVAARAPGAAKLKVPDELSSTVTLVGPGPQPANPPAALTAAATREVFDELLLTHDVVLIDTPPLLAVTDAVALLPDVDIVVLVSRLAVTTMDSAKRTKEAIARVPEVVIAGVVVNDLSGLAGYGYGYGSEYGAKQ